MHHILPTMAVFVGIFSVATPAKAEDLPPGFVQGDVVSYSYVPNKTFSPQESIGKLPYLVEYYLLQWTGSDPLEAFHEENIRRIDIVSQWSTAISLYNRYYYFRDEIINLMIRGFRNRQLIILSARPNTDPEKNAHQNLIDILELLWANRDTVLVSPEGDTATGQQLINNILAADLGDEGECGLRTTGLQQLFAKFDQEIRLRVMDGQQPFRHIKGWYNMLGFTAGCYAASLSDMYQYNRILLPTNTQAIGVDVYHYWFGQASPFDPANLSIPRSNVRAHSDEWQRLRTRYYPGGLDVSYCPNSGDPVNWIPECWNDTHALMNNIVLSGATGAMMWYIAVCGQLGPGTLNNWNYTYTTPIETMESYYDHLKAGPWSAVHWWVFATDRTCHGGLEYYDKTLTHYTQTNPEGVPYSQAMLDYWHDAYVAMKMRMFNDVIYNQFGHLNPLIPVLEAVTPDPENVTQEAAYARQLNLTQGSRPVTWTVIDGPRGLSVDANGYVSGWIPTRMQIGNTYTITVQASNAAGSAQVTWHVTVQSLPQWTIGWFPFNDDPDGWTTEEWRAGSLDFGTIKWSPTNGRQAGNMLATGGGITNDTDSCKREGGRMTRLVPTVGYNNIQIEYDVIAALNTSPGGSCSGSCTTNLLVSGSCVDRLAVYYSTAGVNGPWTRVQNLIEGSSLPSAWTHRTISLTSVSSASNNPNFALRFAWQFNTSADTGRIDNVLIRGTSLDGNTAPQVEIGPDLITTMPDGVELDGTVTDDGKPNPPARVTVTWSMSSGPGTVIFGDANAVDTSAHFSIPGVYVLRLTASDTLLSNYNEVTVTVHPPLPSKKAGDPDPPDGATKVDTSAQLNWTAGHGATAHRIYFGESDPPAYRTEQSTLVYDPGILNRLTTYYWRIDEVDAMGTTTGDLWSFTTQSAPGDFDEDNDVDLTDFGYLQACFKGSGVPYPPDCESADLDNDGDVDQADFNRFKPCLEGPNRPPGC